MFDNHKIPNKSRLYFGKSANLKRDIEYNISKIIQKKDYEEIATPIFTYAKYQEIDKVSNVIRLSGEDNNTLALRADSTLDVVRLITSRLGRTTKQKKWFYIQPIFCYPSSEIHQIGLEDISEINLEEKLKLLVEIFEFLEIQPTIQLSNIKISNILIKEGYIQKDDFKNNLIFKILEHKEEWIRKLAKSTSIKELQEIYKIAPTKVKNAVDELLDIAMSLSYKNIIIEPLYYENMKYYESLFFRAFIDNALIARGGLYKDDGIKSSGFAIYTDNLIEYLEKEIDG